MDAPQRNVLREHPIQLQPEKYFRFGNLHINVFNDTTKLNRSVAENICQEMKQGGLVVLPSDSTHGNEKGKPPGQIYKFLDKLIAKTKVPSTLRVTHMDELDGGNTSFSESIKKWLPTLVKRLGNRFHAIDINNFTAYKNLMETGPRVIVGGIGAATPPHVAYIGEETNPDTSSQILNTEPKRIKLRDQESNRKKCTHAFTMGMNSFKPANKNLQTVILTAKGEKKAKAVKHALKEALGFANMAKSACGQILKQFASSQNKNGPKLVLNLDQELFKKLPSDLLNKLLRI
jgi:6-phosphogluconolactonase/glucosamine-6-phosphate isomerase/deaminase